MNKLTAALLVGIAGSIPVFASSPAHAGPIVPEFTLNYDQLLAPGAMFKVNDKVYYDFKLDVASNGLNYWNRKTGGNFDAVYMIRTLDNDMTSFSAGGLNISVATPATPLTVTYSYQVKIDPAGRQYKDFNTGGTFVGNGSSPMFSGKLEAKKADMTSLGMSMYTYPTANMGNTASIDKMYTGPISFSGTLTLNKQVRVTAFTDTLTQIPVPGPLPIVGATAAFGFSRKLRRRVSSLA